MELCGAQQAELKCLPLCSVGMTNQVRTRLTFAAAYLAFCTGAVFPPAQAEGTKAVSPHNTGKTAVPETKGQKQPQGHTGPLETTGPSAPADNPQGETPPGMQASPEESSPTTVNPKK